MKRRLADRKIEDPIAGGALFTYQRPDPCFRIPFQVVPSWNDILSSSQSNSKFNPIANDIKKWRDRGRKRCVEVFRAMNLPIVTIRRDKRTFDKNGRQKFELFEGLETALFTEPVGCLVRLWRPTAAAYDVHNLVVKPLIDGFADVRLYETDAVRGFPELAFTFEGIDPTLKLTDDEKQERKDYLDRWRLRQRNPPRLPVPARIYFDFYRLSRLEFGTVLQFVKKG